MSAAAFALVFACVAGAALGVPLEVAALLTAAVAIGATLPAQEVMAFLGHRALQGTNAYLLAGIAMFALTGELYRVMGAETAVRRLLQSALAGRRAAPLLVPVLGEWVQGLLLMRVGLSLDAEARAEAREMLPLMQAQGVAPPLAWRCLCAGAATALLMPTGFLAMLTGITHELSMTRQMLALVPVAALLACVLLAQLLLATHRNPALAPVPPLAPQRVLQLWRDQQGVTWLLLTPLSVLVPLVSGISTPSESFAFVGAAAFVASWSQPVRPRVKDLLAALNRAAVLTARLALLLLAGVMFATALALLRPAEPATQWPALVVAIVLLLVVPALLGAVAGVLGAVVLCAGIAGPVMAAASAPAVAAVQLALAAVIGATLSCVLRAPQGMASPTRWGRWRDGLSATGALLLAWAALLVWPGIAATLPQWLLG